MKLVIKDRYNVVVNDYVRKVIVSKNLCFGKGMPAAFPNASTPLDSDNKIIIKQDDEWKETTLENLPNNASVWKKNHSYMEGESFYFLNTVDNAVDQAGIPLEKNKLYFGVYYSDTDTGNILNATEIEKMRIVSGAGGSASASDVLLKFEWSGSISSKANKKQWAILNYGEPRNYINFRRYITDSDIMNDIYKVPFINVQPFDIEITHIVFQAGYRQYQRDYKMMFNVMKANNNDIAGTKQHLFLDESWSVTKHREHKIFDASSLIETKVNSGEFVTVGIGIDNTNDGSNRALYFSSFTIYAKKV